MAKQTINLGTSANKGDGDPLRTAFDKVNDNFDEVYSLLGATGGDVDDVVAPMLVHDQHTNVTVTRDDDANIIIFSVDQAVTDLKGSVFGDDSTLLVDSVNSKIVGAIETTTINASAIPNGGVQTGEGAWNLFLKYQPDTGEIKYHSIDFRDILSNLGNIDADLRGSVFADDSTLLVDAVAGKIVGPIETATISGVTDIVSGANLDQNMYISTKSGGTAYTNAAFRYSSALSSPVTEFVGPTVLEAIKVGDIDILYAPTIFADTNPGSGNKIDLTITAGVDNGNTGFQGQLNLGTNNTDTINIGTGGIADTINIGDDTTTITTINGKLQILSTPPATSKGAADDVPGLVAFDNFYIYYCTSTYDGVLDIWKRVAWTGDTW